MTIRSSGLSNNPRPAKSENNVKDRKLVKQESGTKAQHKELMVQDPKLSSNTVSWGSVNAVQKLKTQAPTPLQKGDFETQARQDTQKVVHLQDESNSAREAQHNVRSCGPGLAGMAPNAQRLKVPAERKSQESRHTQQRRQSTW